MRPLLLWASRGHERAHQPARQNLTGRLPSFLTLGVLPLDCPRSVQRPCGGLGNAAMSEKSCQDFIFQIGLTGCLCYTLSNAWLDRADLAARDA